MTCTHLQQLYQLCQTHDIKVSSSDVVRFACKSCEKVEVCPSMLVEEYDERTANVPAEAETAKS